MNALHHIAQKGKLSLGLVFPIEAYKGAIPSMLHQEKLAKQAEKLGFKALWFRDIPFHDPNFGDAGQLYDPWVYMTHIMNQTHSIALASGSIILPLRHPVHTAKALQSLQVLSKGRIILGVASGDRAIEYPAFKQSIHLKSELFRDNFLYIKSLLNSFPTYESKFYGKVQGAIDILPKSEHPSSFLVTGHAGQSLDWIAKEADGWLYYPRDINTLQYSLSQWNTALRNNNQPWKPYLQSLYIDLVEDEKALPTPIHLGIRTGSAYLRSYLKLLESYGVNHVIINLKYSTQPANAIVNALGDKILPYFT